MTSRFTPFALEHYQSQWERTVEMNLADSSVQCLRTDEWLSPEEQAAYLRTPLYYPEVNGTAELRRRIASLYPAATAANVLVTVGAAQATKLICETLLTPADDVVVITPGYRQVWGLAANTGCTVREVPLDEANGWRFDADALDAAMNARTKLVAVVNPNNPTGTVLTEADMARVIAACARVGAWLHADEVYAGTEHDGVASTPTFWGRYDRLVCTNSLSKAYGLAGARIGWVVASDAMIEALWRRHEYDVIAASAPGMALAEVALQPEKRRWLFDRQQGLTRDGWGVMREWLTRHGTTFSIASSSATAIAFVKYAHAASSFAVAEHIRQTGSTLVAPGEYLGAPGHLRVTLGYAPQKVQAALERIAAGLASLGD